MLSKPSKPASGTVALPSYWESADRDDYSSVGRSPKLFSITDSGEGPVSGDPQTRQIIIKYAFVFRHSELYRLGEGQFYHCGPYIHLTQPTP